MNTHQVDEGKNGLIWLNAAPFDQQTRSIAERFGRIPLETERRLPDWHHQWRKREFQHEFRVRE
jgi:hypothetical protein